MVSVDAGRMTRHGGERSGQLVLRAWVEDGSPYSLRVRIIRVYRRGEPSVMAAATVEATCAIVQNWLDELLGTASTTEPPPPVTRP
jgi:hypothetical protein